MMLSLLSLLSLTSALAHAEPASTDWLHPAGAGDHTWQASSQPLDVRPRPRDFYLPDAGYVGRNPADRPDDLELTGAPAGERHFLRYVDGKLVDAWMLRAGPIDPAPWQANCQLDWSGPLLGHAEDGYRAYGDAESWNCGDRTALHWRDRTSDQEIMISRAQPTGQYAVHRAEPLVEGSPGRHPAKLKGELRRWARPYADAMSGCLDLSPKPVQADVLFFFTSAGLPGRIRVNVDQTAPGALDCFAGALVTATALPETTGSLTVFRMR